MNVIVLGGAGAMGSAAVRDLAGTSDFDEIVVADGDAARAEALCQELGGGRVRAVALDASDGTGLRSAFERFSVVLNATTYALGLVVTEAAIAAKRPMLDLGGLYNTPRQLALDPQARDAGVTVVLGMGATPGVTNLMARAGAAHMDELHEIHVAFATFRPMGLSPGLLSTVLDEWSPGTARFHYEDGRYVEVPPFHGEKEVAFAPPVGRVPTYIVPHSEVHTLPRFLPGVRRVDVRGTWRPEIMAALRLYGQAGLLSTDPIRLGGVSVAPKEVLRSLYLDRGTRGYEGEYAFFLHVEVAGRRGASEVVATYDLSHPALPAPSPPPWGPWTTGSITGIPASIGAQRLARGEVSRTGVLAPEAAFDPGAFFADLGRRGIRVAEEVVVRTRLAA